MKLFGGGRPGAWRLAVIALALGAFAFFPGIMSWPDQWRGMRSVNQEDELYRYVAQELAEPGLCEMIPWSAESPGGFFIASSYERSNCYDFIAGRTKDPWICLEVRRLGFFRLLSQQTSMWSCLGDAWHGRNAGIAVSQEKLASFFHRLGYDPDTIHLEGITPPLVNLKDVYRQLPGRPDIIARIQKAIAASSDATNTAYLADMAAVVTVSPKWCLRISDDLAMASRWKFRDWCVFTVVSNSGNMEHCRLLASGEGADPRLLLQCESQARSPDRKGRYGPETPDTDDRIRTLITMLGYEIPRAKDLPLGTVAAAYGRFLEELNRGSDSLHAAARQKFIARVRALGRNRT